MQNCRLRCRLLFHRELQVQVKRHCLSKMVSNSALFTLCFADCRAFQTAWALKYYSVAWWHWIHGINVLYVIGLMFSHCSNPSHVHSFVTDCFSVPLCLNFCFCFSFFLAPSALSVEMLSGITWWLHASPASSPVTMGTFGCSTVKLYPLSTGWMHQVWNLSEFPSLKSFLVPDMSKRHTLICFLCNHTPKRYSMEHCTFRVPVLLSPVLEDFIPL